MLGMAWIPRLMSALVLQSSSRRGFCIISGKLWTQVQNLRFKGICQQRKSARTGFCPANAFQRCQSRYDQIVQDEIFGPVVSVTPFETEEKAVSITNQSKYGLTNIIYSRDNKKCMRTARRIDTDMVFVNNNFRNLLGTPFGGRNILDMVESIVSRP